MQALARGDLSGAPVSSQERALLEFVRRLTEQPHTTRPEHTDALRRAGWSDDQIAEAVYIAAMFAFFNRVADAFGIEPMGYLAANRVTR